MATELDGIINDILKMDIAERVAFGQKALKIFCRGLHEGGLDDDHIRQAIANFTKLFVSADRHCHGDEYSYFKAITGLDISPENFYKMTNNGADPKFIDASLECVNILRSNDRMAVALYGAALLACDDKVTDDEKALLAKIYYSGN